MVKKESLYRYNLALPTKLMKEIREVAHAKGVTAVDVMRAYFKLGLYLTKLQDSGDLTFRKEGELPTRIKILF